MGRSQVPISHSGKVQEESLGQIRFDGGGSIHCILYTYICYTVHSECVSGQSCHWLYQRLGRIYIQGPAYIWGPPHTIFPPPFTCSPIYVEAAPLPLSPLPGFQIRETVARSHLVLLDNKRLRGKPWNYWKRTRIISSCIVLGSKKEQKMLGFQYLCVYQMDFEWQIGEYVAESGTTLLRSPAAFRLWQKIKQS